MVASEPCLQLSDDLQRTSVSGESKSKKTSTDAERSRAHGQGRAENAWRGEREREWHATPPSLSAIEVQADTERKCLPC